MTFSEKFVSFRRKWHGKSFSKIGWFNFPLRVWKGVSVGEIVFYHFCIVDKTMIKQGKYLEKLIIWLKKRVSKIEPF